MATLITITFVAASAGLLWTFLTVTVREMKRLGNKADGVVVPVASSGRSMMIRPALRRSVPAEA